MSKGNDESGSKSSSLTFWGIVIAGLIAGLFGIINIIIQTTASRDLAWVPIYATQTALAMSTPPPTTVPTNVPPATVPPATVPTNAPPATVPPTTVPTNAPTATVPPTTVPTNVTTTMPPASTSIPTSTPVTPPPPPTPEGMVFVPAGTFWMGKADADNHAAKDEMPGALIYADTFWIDKYEVNNLQYKTCVDLKRCQPPLEVFSPQWQNAAFGNPAHYDRPVVYISQSSASQYCQWLGKRLPYEYEWEKAARGSGNQRIYPWGNLWDGTLVNAANNFSVPLPVAVYPYGCSPYGACNMAGNVAEWIADHFNGKWYNDRYVIGLLTNPIYWGTPGTQFNVRGGSFKSPPNDVRVSKRWSEKGDNATMNHVGFRCAK